jgi:hypothetical protein
MAEYFIYLKEGALLVEVGMPAPQGYVTASNQPETYLAILDTGADMSVISPNVAKQMRPPELGMQPVLLPGLRYSLEPTFYVQFRIGGHRAEGPWHPLVVASTEPATPNVDVILDMDLLSTLDWGWQGSVGFGSILSLG